MADWREAACRLIEAAGVCVAVRIVEVRGSAPRDSGTAMLVTADGVDGTIGGGQLEFGAIAAARALLASTAR